MGIGLSQAVCPRCGHQGMLINTEDWKPVRIRCNRTQKCGWGVDLRPFWGKDNVEKETK